MAFYVGPNPRAKCIDAILSYNTNDNVRQRGSEGMRKLDNSAKLTKYVKAAG